MEMVVTLMHPGRCAKQTCMAVVVSLSGECFVGYNWCAAPQKECPRKDMATGVGYEMCREICQQHSHAEVDACEKAGDKARGATVLVYGHYYCCDGCIATMERYGIRKVLILH